MNKEADRKRRREYMRERRKDPEFKKKEREYQLQHYYKLRQEVYEAYGGAKCACCGEDEFDFLTLDHINDNGAAERRRFGSNHRVMQVLRQQGYPPGYQVLCANCNMSKMKHGECIHKLRKETE